MSHFQRVTDFADGRFWIGILLSLTGSILSSLGLAFQRLSHKKNQALPPEKRIRSSKQWLNIFGVFLLFADSLGGLPRRLRPFEDARRHGPLGLHFSVRGRTRLVRAGCRGR